MTSRYAQGLAVVVLSTVVLAGCGRSGHASQNGSAAGTSIAAAVIAFIAPRDGADAVIGAQLGNFAQTVQSKVLDDCMTSDGFTAPPFFMGVGRHPISATRSFPTCRRSRPATTSGCSPVSASSSRTRRAA